MNLEAQPELAIAGHRWPSLLHFLPRLPDAVVRRYDLALLKDKARPAAGLKFSSDVLNHLKRDSEKVLCFVVPFGLRCLQLKLSTLETLCLHLCLLSKRLGAVVLWCCEYRDFVSK